ncbi:MAG TPA: outer membrane protein assembly factor BamD, partial [Ktedonobacterales bacterium]|nr:outer membrane protein assembly factor BamD [Ktedonobacterales bacterium]
WVQANDPSVPYSDAIADFVAYRSNPQCDATCQTSARAVEAQARYLYGTQLLAKQQYSAAIQQLEVVQSQFSDSPYATQAHLAAAQAYLALGQQQLQSACADAVPTYQTLASKYSDTPEGAQAKAALAAPQNVTGNISGFTDPTRTVYLSHSVNLGNFFFSQDYHSSVDSQGNFTFKNVKQGKYNLSAASYVSGNFIIYPYWSEGNNLYSVQVGPLCPTDLGQLSFK